jgi:hypothetical protein
MDNFNIHKFLKDQYLAESFDQLNENYLTNDEMQKESDVDKLKNAIEKGLNIEISDRLGSGTYNGRKGYYLKVSGRNPKYWEDDQIQKIEKVFKIANNQTEKYDFEYEGVSDYETDDDRYWPASISLFAIEKKLDELNSIPTSPGEIELGDDGEPHVTKMSNSERKMALRNVLDVLGKHYPELTVDDKLEFITVHSKDFFNGNVDPYDEEAIKDEYEEYFTFNSDFTDPAGGSGLHSHI